MARQSAGYVPVCAKGHLDLRGNSFEYLAGNKINFVHISTGRDCVLLQSLKMRCVSMAVSGWGMLKPPDSMTSRPKLDLIDTFPTNAFAGTLGRCNTKFQPPSPEVGEKPQCSNASASQDQHLADLTSHLPVRGSRPNIHTYMFPCACAISNKQMKKRPIRRPLGITRYEPSSLRLQMETGKTPGPPNHADKYKHGEPDGWESVCWTCVSRLCFAHRTILSFLVLKSPGTSHYTLGWRGKR
jgi:hypothetical protein